MLLPCHKIFDNNFIVTYAWQKLLHLKSNNYHCYYRVQETFSAVTNTRQYCYFFLQIFVTIEYQSVTLEIF